jgi:hypothetical protein
MLYRAKFAVCSEIHTKNIHGNTLCGQNDEIWKVKTAGTYSDHWALNKLAGDVNSLWSLSVSFMFLSSHHDGTSCGLAKHPTIHYLQVSWCISYFPDAMYIFSCTLCGYGNVRMQGASDHTTCSDCYRWDQAILSDAGILKLHHWQSPVVS